MTRVLLTGATGFVGSAVARALLASGAVVGVLRRPGGDPRRLADILPRLTDITGDLTGLSAAAPAVRDFAPDTVIHSAWWGVTNRDRNDLAQYENLPATLALLRLSRDAGAKHWVGLGSQAEYGPCSGAIAESEPTRPTTLYGVTKLATCLYAQHLGREWGLRVAWLRLFSSYGPDDDPSWLIPYLIGELLGRREPKLTPGEQRWDYIHVDDVAAAIVAVARTPAAEGVFNLGSGEAPRLREVVESIRDRIDPALPLGFGEVPYRPDQVMHLQADTRRLRGATGWRPAVPLDRGLSATIDWHRSRMRGET